MIFKNYGITNKLFKGSKLVQLVKKAGYTVYTVYQMIYKYITEFPYTFTSSGDDIEHFMLFGNTVQNGTPTLTNTVEAISVAGENTSNLIDISKIANDAIEVNTNGRYFDILKNYATSTGITVPEFLRMSGLKAGDTITTVAEIEDIAGSGGNWGSITLLSRDTTKAQSINLLPYGKRIHTVTLPNDLNHTNHYGIYVYGHSADDENGERRVRIKNLRILKGQYTTETLPEYEPYGYWLPIKINDNITKIYIKQPLRRIVAPNFIYMDELDISSQRVIRRIHSEYITTVTNRSFTTGYTILISLLEKRPAQWSTSSLNEGVCLTNKFQSIDGVYADLRQKPNSVITYRTNGGSNRVAYTTGTEGALTVAQGNTAIGEGFEVIYPLYTTEYEQYTMPKIKTDGGINTLTTDTETLPYAIEMVYKGIE